jgi:hypothetical protein
MIIIDTPESRQGGIGGVTHAIDVPRAPMKSKRIIALLNEFAPC